MHLSGQVCGAHTRVLVPRSRYGEAVEAARPRRPRPCRSVIRTDPATVVGPLVAERQRGPGGGLPHPGRRGRRPAWRPAAAGPPTWTTGWYVAPTILADRGQLYAGAGEEISGRSCACSATTTEDDASAWPTTRPTAWRAACGRRPARGLRRRGCAPGASRSTAAIRRSAGAVRRVQGVPGWAANSARGAAELPRAPQHRLPAALHTGLTPP